MHRIFALATLAVSPAVVADTSDVPDGSYSVDPQHGYILFSYSHFGLSNPPVFDEHLRGEDFFQTDQYPTISFVATSIESKGDSGYAVTGDLTMKGVTKPITLDASIVATMHPFREVPVVGVSASGQLKRSDWNLGAYAPSVSDEVTLSIEVEMLKD